MSKKEVQDATEVKQSPRREGGITTGAMRAFVAIAEAESFSKAAASLGVAQPTISLQLNALEQACGVPLLHRRPKIMLTDAGRELYVRARQILSRLDELEAYTRDLKSLDRGRLSIGTSTPGYAMPLVATFLKGQPAIGVHTRIGNTSALLDDLTQCRIDVAVMTLDVPVATMHCTLIQTQKLVVCAPASKEWKAKESIRMSELTHHPLVMREQGSMTRRLLEEAFEKRGESAQVRLEVGSREAVREAVAAGIGLGVLLEGELRGDTRLVELPLAGSNVAGGVYAVTLKEAVDIPAVGAFLEHASSFKTGPAS